MGYLVYDSTFEAEFDDRLLTHLQIVISAKVRRHESFMFSWKDHTPGATGRTSIYIHPGTSLRFCYTDAQVPAISRAWTDELSALANSAGGLTIVDEPAE